ncbi:MAG: hypothetical protein ACRDTX_28035 [Pseudonocardiaceae bacterium]
MTAAISEGYTLVTCVAPACGTEQPDRLAVVLRDCVLSSRDGVLVVSGCSLGAVSCPATPTAGRPARWSGLARSAANRTSQRCRRGYARHGLTRRCCLHTW